MRINISVVFESAQLWFEVSAERQSGDGLAFGASKVTVAEALNRAISDATTEPVKDTEYHMTLSMLERLRSILGPGALVH